MIRVSVAAGDDSPLSAPTLARTRRMPLSRMRSASGVTWPPPAISVLMCRTSARAAAAVSVQGGIDEVADRRAKGAQHVDAAFEELGCLRPTHQRARHIGQRAAAGVEIEHVIALGQQRVLDVVGDLRGRKTSGSAPATSTDGTPADLSCDWCGKGGSDAENCPHNRNTGAICATKADR